MGNGRLVFEDGAVVGQVDFRRGSLDGGVTVDSGGVSGTEGLEGRKRLFSESELSVDFGPVLITLNTCHEGDIY